MELLNISNLETTDLNLTIAMFTMLMSLLLGIIISFTYKKTQDEAIYQKSLAVTLVMLPIILSIIILFVGSNVARAFSLAGTLSIIRFRSAPGDAKDIGFIFFDIAAGLACGVGLYWYGLLFVVLLCIVLIIVEKSNMFEQKNIQKILKITIPEDLNYSGVFDDILKKYTKKYTLEKIQTTDLGSLYQIVYIINPIDNINEKEFIDELRCKNGNLTIILSEKSRVIIK